MKNNKLFFNIGISMLVQVVSLLTSFVVSLVVPKFIDILDYSHWQTYVLYSSYVSIFQFGLIDGFILKYSKYDYDELNKEEIRSQLQIFLLFLSAISICTIIIAVCFLDGVSKILAILLAISIVVKNHFWYSSTICQITYRIDKYSKITILQRASYLIVVVILLLAGVKNFYWFCIADIVGDLASGILAIKYNKELIIGKIKNVKNTFKDIGDNIKCGITLLLANYSTALIIGAAKMLVQFKWGDITFGKISFGFSLTNLFLTFITAISVVLFPSLKRIDENRLPDMYVKIRKISSSVMFLALSVYYPVALIINAWIPKYSESIRYMLYLLPLVVFVTRTNLLTNNYLKIFRREKHMFAINITFAILGITLYSLFAFVIESLIGILISVVIVEILKFFVSEIVVCRDIKRKTTINILLEIGLCCIFYFSMLCLKPLFATTVYLLACLIYIFVSYIMTKKRKTDLC